MQTATKQMNLRMGGVDLLQRMPYEAPDMQIVHVQIEKWLCPEHHGRNR